MERYDRDRRSVFCGNLPSDVTEAQLRQAFGRTGDYIKSMEIVKGTHSAYAFIEFNRADVYETAIELLVRILSFLQCGIREQVLWLTIGLVLERK